MVRQERICAAQWGPARQCGPEHDARTRRGECRLEPVSHLQTPGEAQSAIPGGGVQLEQYASVRKPESQRQCHEPRENPRHASEPRNASLARVPVWITSELLAFS